MTTEANPNDLMGQAKSYEESADALSPKIVDAAIHIDERKKIFAQSVALRNAAFQLHTDAANAIVKDLSVEVTELQAEIDKAKNILKTISKVKDIINIATSAAELATAVATGQPAGILTAFSKLQSDIVQVSG